MCAGVVILLTLFASKRAVETLHTFVLQLVCYASVGLVCLVAMLWILWKYEHRAWKVFRELQKSENVNKED